MCSIQSQRRAAAGPVREKDADALVRDLSAATGNQFTFRGMAELGDTNGAVFIQWPDGRESVLTRTRYPIQHLERAAEILDLARARGIPVPRYELITALQDWTILIQERLPGAPLAGRRTMTLPMMEAVLALNESFAGLLSDRPEIPAIGVRPGAEVTAGTARYATLESYDNRTRQLLARIREIHQTSDGPITGHDLVHGDFSPPNILFDQDRNLTGIVDWHDHTLYRGDRRYSLVILRFELAWGIARGWTPADPAALRRLDEALDTIEPATLRLYWTYPSLNLLAAMIHEDRRTDIDCLLAIAWSRLH